MEKKFYSNGKLLITGEYVVLDGALALALPTKFGQNLTVEPIPSKQILWKSFDQDGSVWFEDAFTFDEIINKPFDAENSVKNTLLEILHEALDKLPEIQKTVVLLRDYEGYNYAEIAEITTLSESQVKVYIFRARQALKEYIKRMDLVV